MIPLRRSPLLRCNLLLIAGAGLMCLLPSAVAEMDAPEDKEPGQAKPEPRAVENIVAREAGLIEHIGVSLGDRVQEGQVIGHLDHHRQYHALQTARIRAADKSKIRELEAEVSLTQAILEDHNEQARRRRISNHTLRQSEARANASLAKLDAAKTAQELSEAALEEAQGNYDRRFFRVPFSGVVVAVHKDKNETVGVGNPIVTIADHSHWVVRHTIPEAIAEKLQVGRTIPIYQAGSQIARVGRITGITPADDGMQTVEVMVENPRAEQSAEPPAFEEPRMFSPPTAEQPVQ